MLRVPAGVDILYVRPFVVSLLAILQFTGAGFWFLVGTICLCSLAPMFGLCLALPLLTLSTLNFFCGYGLWKLKRYGRTLQLVFSWIGLIGFPLGTIISILILVYLYRPQIKVLFSEKPPASLTAEEAKLLSEIQQPGAGTLAIVAVMIVLVFFANIGIIAAIAVPNLLNAIDRGKEKRTMADIRMLGTAVESYAVDMDHFPVSATLSTLESLNPVKLGIEPRYASRAPLKDGWEGAYYYQTDPNGRTYELLSMGKDRKMSSQSKGPTQDFDCDIIYRDGIFTAYPEGVQT